MVESKITHANSIVPLQNDLAVTGISTSNTVQLDG